jgi:hypothetical protein
MSPDVRGVSRRVSFPLKWRPTPPTWTFVSDGTRSDDREAVGRSIEAVERCKSDPHVAAGLASARRRRHRSARSSPPGLSRSRRFLAEIAIARPRPTLLRHSRRFAARIATRMSLVPA